MITIPARYLTDFHASDPPVQTRSGHAISHAAWDGPMLTRVGAALAVEQSMPTLLRALARAYGATLLPGEVPRWYREGPATWWLVWGGEHEQGFGPAAQGKEGVLVPALTEDMNRLEALAAVIAWQVKQ